MSYKTVDGFATDWKPTLLYITAATILSAVIVIAQIQSEAHTREVLREIVVESCSIAVEETLH